MTGDFDTEGKYSLKFNIFTEELQCALDEIKKNEKDISMIAMVAQTLFEKTGDM